MEFVWSLAVAGHALLDVPLVDVFPTNRDALDLPHGQRFAHESDFDDANELDLRERMIAEVARLEGHSRQERRRRVLVGKEYLEFASVDADDDSSVLGFARAHGLLGRPLHFKVPGTRRMADGEALSTWRREIWDMSAVLGAYRSADGSPGMVPVWPSDAQRQSVQKAVNLRIGEHVGSAARLLWDRPTERLALRLVPRTLLGALWLQLAQAIDAGTRYARCAACHRFLALHPDTALGRRGDARYCSSACRQRAWRARSGTKHSAPRLTLGLAEDGLEGQVDAPPLLGTPRGASTPFL